MFILREQNPELARQYADEAVKNGAAAIVSVCDVKADVPVVRVHNARRAEADIAKVFYGEPKPKLIAVTGTNGKTTTTFIIAHILKNLGKKVGIIGTNGAYTDGATLASKSTCPTTPEACELYRLLAEMSDCDWAVIEVSSHALVQERCRGLRFEVGVFTNLTPEHLDFHSDMEDYYKAKKRLFDYSQTAVVNADDEYGRRLSKELALPCVSYGVMSGDLVSGRMRFYADKVEFTTTFLGRSIRQELALTGLFSVYNALAACLAVISLGFEYEAVCSALKGSITVTGRLERLEFGTPYNIIIDYAHTPDGLAKVINAVREFTKGRIITLFGCGGDRDRTKRPKMGRIASELSDVAVITSDNPRTEAPNEIIIDILSGVKSENYIVIPNRRTAIAEALSGARADDTVILAGKGQETYQIIGTQKYDFDEREIVKEILLLC